uniref:Nucleoporin ndc-1 (inferred by orthology to a C. elegans protein) n=1 Tax=Strongyloides venezuelensis TaxID=75913 RepID=A0A0K0FDT4_STRVS
MFPHERQFRDSFNSLREESPKKSNLNFKRINPTPDDVRAKIEVWFHSLLLKRKLVSSIGVAIIASVALFIQTIITEFNITKPFSSLEQIFSNFFTFSFWFILFIQASIIFGLVFSMSHLVMSVSTPDTLRFDDGISIIFCASLIVGECLNVFFTFLNAQDPTSRHDDGDDLASARFTYHVFALIFVCTNFVFSTNFRYCFSDDEIPFQNVILSILTPSSRSIYTYKYQDAIKSFKRATLLWLFYHVIVDFWSIKYLFTTGLLLYIIMIIYRIHLVYNFGVEILNLIVMQPYKFEMPTIYNITEPSEKQSRHIVNVFNCSDLMMKFFALYDIRYVAEKDYKRRCEIFQLSIPGNYPRNWNSIKNICLEVVNLVNGGISNANDIIHTTKMRDAAHLYGDPSSRFRQTMEFRDFKGIHDSGLWERQSMKGGERLNDIGVGRMYGGGLNEGKKDKLNGIAENIKNFIIPPKRFIYPADYILAMYAIESIALIVSQSVEEDEFGSVQSDVIHIVRELLKFYENLKKYSTHKYILPSNYNTNDDEIIRNLQSALQRAIVKILSPFMNLIENFSVDEQELIQKLF